MALQGQGEVDEVLSEINVTPLVDIMLVLLVVFIVTAPLLTNAVKVHLPQTSTTAPIEQTKAVTISIDRDGTIVFYSQTEARQSGYGEIPIGRNMFEISPCMANNDFQGRIKRAMDEGPVDLEFGWAGDFADPTRDLRLRVISSSNNGIWIFVERDSAVDPR